MEETEQELISNLRWQVEAGVIDAVGETTVDRFLLSAKERSVPNKPTTPQEKPVINKPASPQPVQVENSTMGSEESIKLSQQAVLQINTLDELKIALGKFSGCPSLKDKAKNTVFYKGSENPTILCVGLCPNKQDDETGIPFTGNREILLGRMFKAIGIDNKKIGLINSVFWYPPGGRSLTTGEIATSKPFLLKAIEIIKPEHLVIFGADASKNIINTKDGISRIHGKTFDLNENKQLKATVMYSPEYILQNPTCKPLVWQDLKNLRNQLNILN